MKNLLFNTVKVKFETVDNVAHVDYCISCLSTFIWTLLVCVHVYVLCVFYLCVRVCECLYFILVLPKGE